MQPLTSSGPTREQPDLLLREKSDRRRRASEPALRRLDDAGNFSPDRNCDAREGEPQANGSGRRSCRNYRRRRPHLAATGGCARLRVAVGTCFATLGRHRGKFDTPEPTAAHRLLAPEPQVQAVLEGIRSLHARDGRARTRLRIKLCRRRRAERAGE